MSPDYTHCPHCGGALARRETDGRDRLVCGSCTFVFYENPAPAAGVVVVGEEGLLWVKRRFNPRRGLWTLPAGFLEWDEHVEECAAREAKEETGLDVQIKRLFGAYMAHDDPRTRVVLLLYVADVVGGNLTPGDDAIEARFFPLDAPPPIAFQAHREALDDIRREFGE